jgi:hypothetical protein
MLVIAHDIQDSRKLRTHTLKKISGGVTTLALLVQIFEHDNIASKNQKVSALCVSEINVTKLHM